MRRSLIRAGLPAFMAAGLLFGPGAARAVVHYGNAAPNFMKARYNSNPAVTLTVDTYAFKIRVFFLLGHNCPFCVSDGPSFEANVNQYYQTVAPGAVQCVGFDLYNGSPAQVGSFVAQTGASFPVGLQAASETGGNMSTLYGPFDNYVIVDKLGIVRYHAADRWPHGNRYHLNEIRAVVDSLLAAQTGVDEEIPPPAATLQLGNRPNPFSSSTRILLSNLTSLVQPARVSVFDALGRRIATLYEGIVSPGLTTIAWDGQMEEGASAPSGVYFVRADVGGETVSHQILRTR